MPEHGRVRNLARMLRESRLRRWLAAASLLLAGVGCAQVRLVRRDGCWVRQTETFPKTIREEVGPCARPEPKWSADRIERLVQECIAETDYRWQSQALAAWNRGQVLPEQASEKAVMRQCMDHVATAVVAENEALKRRLVELTTERDELQKLSRQERERLQASHDQMTEALGEAAKKPAPSAIATSNSTGTASTQAAPGSSARLPGPEVELPMPKVKRRPPDGDPVKCPPVP